MKSKNETNGFSQNVEVINLAFVSNKNIDDEFEQIQIHVDKDPSLGPIINNENGLSSNDVRKYIKGMDLQANNAQQEFVHMEGGWGWIVLLSTVWSYGLSLAWYTNYNLIYPHLINFYNETEEYNVFYSAKIGSVSYGLIFFFSAPSSVLIDLFGPNRISITGSLLSAIGLLLSAFLFYSKNLMKVHLFTFGVLFGIGQSLIYSASFAILPHYFEKKLGLAMGLLNTGSCLLIIISSLVMAYLLNNFGLTITFYIMCGLTLSCAFTSFTMKPQLPREENKTLKERVKESMGLAILKKPKFIIWVVATLFGTYGNIIPLVTMSHFSILNFPGFQPQILNVIYGISSGLGSIVFGKLIDHLQMSIAYNYIASFFVYGLGILLILFTKNLYIYLFINVIFGLFDGLYLLSLVPMAREAADSSLYANQAMGYVSTFSTLSIIIAPALSGALFEVYNDYFYAYTLSYSFSFLASLIMLFYPGLIFQNLLKKLKKKFAKQNKF